MGESSWLAGKINFNLATPQQLQQAATGICPACGTNTMELKVPDCVIEWRQCSRCLVVVAVEVEVGR